MSAPNAPRKSSRPSFQEPSSLMTPLRRLNLQEEECFMPNAPRKLNHPFSRASLTPIRINFADPVMPGAPIADRKRKLSDSSEQPQPINLFATFQKADENGYDSGYDSPVPAKKVRECPGAPMRPFRF
jgi:hypothetical protein